MIGKKLKVYLKIILNKLEGSEPMTQELKDPPKVFISYSYDNEEHVEWVSKLATDLEETGGADVIFDKWDVRLGQSLTFFMEQGLTDAHLVLCVCSEQYVVKANNRQKGVGYENNILSAQMFQGANSDHIIPIIRTNSTNNKTPTYMAGKQYIDFLDDSKYFDNFRKLKERIWGEDLNKRPERGPNPYARIKADEIDIAVGIDKLKYRDIRMSGTATFNYSNNNGQYTIGSGQYKFDTYWSKDGSTSIHALARPNIEKIGYRSGIKEFPSFENINQGIFDFNSWSRSPKLNEIIIWINQAGYFAATKIISIDDNRNEGEEDILVFDYKIYEQQ